MAVDAHPYARAAFGREEKLFLIQCLLGVNAIFLVKPLFWRNPFFILLFAFSAAGIFLLVKARRAGQPLRGLLRKNVAAFVPDSAGKERGEFFAWTTFALVLLLVLLYYVFERAGIADYEFIRANYVFLPLSVSWWSLLASPLLGIFLHGSAAQLWCGAAFLWVFGPDLEKRVGGKRVICLFILSGLAGKIVAVFAGLAFFHEAYHGWGASPAIAGIMGAFLVRCYFLKPALRPPLPGSPRVTLRVNALLPLGLFFALDLNSGFVGLARGGSGIGHWTHFLSLADRHAAGVGHGPAHRAAEEKFSANGGALVDHPDFFSDGESFLRAALEQNPENETALLGLARLKRATAPVRAGIFFNGPSRWPCAPARSGPPAYFGEYFKNEGSAAGPRPDVPPGGHPLPGGRPRHRRPLAGGDHRPARDRRPAARTGFPAADLRPGRERHARRRRFPPAAVHARVPALRLLAGAREKCRSAE